MHNQIIKFCCVIGLVINSSLAAANIPSDGDLTDAISISFPGEKTTSFESCPVSDFKSSNISCEYRGRENIGNSLFMIDEMDAYPLQIDIYTTSTDNVYL